MAVDVFRLLLLCWLLTWKPADVSAGYCTEPLPVANAYRKWEGGAANTWVNYTCLAGYDHTGGTLTRQCQGGVYSGNAPTCLLNCGPPLNYTHSKTNSTSSLSGAYVSYTCLGTTNQTKDSNQMYCDPAIGRWESPVYCAEMETLIDSIKFLPLSSRDSSSNDVSANDERTSSDDATNYISVTSNNVLITTSDTATVAYTVLSSVDPMISALAPTAVGSVHSTLYSVGTGHTASLVNDGSSSYDSAFSSVHHTSPDSGSTSTPSTEHLSLQPSMSGISIPMTSLTTDVILTPSNQLTVDSSTGIHTNINASSASTFSVSMSSETCPRQDRLVVNLDGGPYEILHVAIIRPSEEDVYNFRLEVHSPKQSCDTASRLPWEYRTIVDCAAQRLFPIGNQLIILGSNPDETTIKICDVEVYGRKPSVDCGVPRPFPGRRVVFTNASLSSTAIYYCDEGYHYRGGPQTVECSLTGYWNNYGLYCSDKEKIEPNVTTVVAALEWTDNDIGTCSPVNGTTLDLAFDLGGKYEIKMVTITTQANTSAASLTMVISRDGLNKTCSVSSGSSYVHQTGEITVAIPCNTAPVGDHLDLFITGLTGDVCEVKVFGRPYTGEGVECRQSDKGVEFKGSVNMTINGLPCLPWTTDSSLQLDQFPDMTWAEASNYCRNPNGRNKPWCYVDLSKNWEECPIVHCDSICRRYQDGSTYKGDVGTTENGKSCIRWNSGGVPFKRTALYPGGSVSMGNCRNLISSMTRPWCYTNASPLQSEFCNIPSCPTASEYVTEYHLLDHHGVLLDVDESNFTECFLWKKKQNSAIRLPKGCDIENHVLGLCGETYSHNMSMMCSIPTENGARWVYSILECVNCGMPSQPPGMKVTYTSTYFSAVATYVCAAGYVRDSGAGNFSCLGTGNWDNATLICKVDCGPPDDVVGARLSYNQTVLGSIAYHQCLVTNETTNVTCGSSGMWDSPAWLVECLVDCGSPPTQNHMNVTYNSTLSGSTAVYVCVDGYVTASGSENVHCQDSGSWTSITLNCVEMSVTPSSSSSSTTATTLSLPTSFTSPFFMVIF
ncbi:uncharacterized protein LOC124286005 [Haliotis rubra]|uniref:uncharacterized protein LOC124286005 n=1 Tax=Haliotis rubra TaxID=36100 RepID=UPI001EE611EA|nr:uncharacterized protein LOC124286005 [Haliotis rubra]